MSGPLSATCSISTTTAGMSSARRSADTGSYGPRSTTRRAGGIAWDGRTSARRSSRNSSALVSCPCGRNEPFLTYFSTRRARLTLLQRLGADAHSPKERRVHAHPISELVAGQEVGPQLAALELEQELTMSVGQVGCAAKEVAGSLPRRLETDGNRAVRERQHL